MNIYNLSVVIGLSKCKVVIVFSNKMVCFENFCDYQTYYAKQAGGQLDISYYRGAPYQRGYGFFTNLAKRYGIPVLKYLFKQGVQTGKDIWSDVAAGKQFSTAAKSNLRKRVASTFQDLGEKISQSGSGMRKRPRLVKKRRKTKRRVKRKLKSKVKRRVKRKLTNKSKRFDIFS